MMTRTMRTRIFMGLLLGLYLAANVLAQGTNQAALVVSLGDGEVITRCVQFEEEQISGYELLARSGLALETDLVGLGSTVCRIDATGCAASDCFCECKGGSCIYWSYWHQRDGNWSYSNVGADTFLVTHGAVDGWVWDIGTPNEAPPPPDLAFEEICTSSVAADGGPDDLRGGDETVITVSPETGDGGVDVPSAATAVGVGVSWPLIALVGLLVIGVVVALVMRR